MAKNTNKEAYYERLKHLADVNKSSLKEAINHNLGTLIDYKRANDGIAYGIIKENHNYFIKKAGTKQNPDVADFAYIGGLSNIKEYQYGKLSEAEKQRNLLLQVINESYNLGTNKTGTKVIIKEDAGEEIDLAAEKIPALDAATDAEETQPEADAEMAAGLEAMPPSPEDGEGSDELPNEVPAAGDEEIPATGEETPAPEGGEEEVPATDNGEETPAPDGGEEDGGKDEIKSEIGKLGEKISDKTLNDNQVADYVSMFLGYFKDYFVEMPIDKRKELAGKITEVSKEQNIEDLETNMPSEPVTADGIEEGEQCAECGSFAMYAESRGYASAEALMECGEEEVGNLVSGYANAHNDGQNDGDLENVALVIKVVNPEILNQLKNDYGHDEYAEKLNPIVTGMNECSQEEGVAKLNELFGGLSNLGKAAVGGIKAGAEKAGQAIGQKAGEIKQAVGQKANQVKQAVGQATNTIKQTYHAGEVNSEVKKLETAANELGAQIAALNTRLQKAGKQPVNVQSLLRGISNQIGVGGQAKVAGTSAGSGIKENTDPAATTIAPGAQSLGIATVKPDGAPVSISESETKIRKYIRARLEEKAGLRKATLNESTKSPALKKLDKVIDEQYALYETVIRKKNITEGQVNEIFGLSAAEKIASLNPQDAAGIEKLFRTVFNDILINPQMGVIGRVAKVTPIETKYNILKQYAEGGGGTLRLAPDGRSVQYAPKSVKDRATVNQFTSGGTGGKTQLGGV